LNILITAPDHKEEGEGDGFPFEIWHYAHLDGIGDNVSLEFVDTDLRGDYKLADRESLIGGSLADRESLIGGSPNEE
jgi:hypothetical protein